MPQLPRYTAQIEPGAISGGRRASADDFGPTDVSGAVRSVQSAAEGYLTSLEDDQDRKVLVANAEIKAKYAKRAADALTSGEDLEKIRTELDDELAKVAEGVSTRRAADNAAIQAANTRIGFDNQANQILIHRAVATAQADGAKFISSLSGQVSADPTSLAQNEQAVDAFVATLSRVPAHLRTQYADDWKRQLNVSAARSVARLSPDQMESALAAGKFNVTPEQRENLLQYAETIKTSRKAAENQERALKEFERRQRDEKAENEITQGILTGQLRGRALADAIANNPDLTASSRRVLTSFAAARAQELSGGSFKSDEDTRRALWLGINADPSDPSKIYNSKPIHAAVQARKLTTEHANQLLAMVAQQRDPNYTAIGTRKRAASLAFSRELSNNFKVVGAMQAHPGIKAEMENVFTARMEERMEELRTTGSGVGGAGPTDVFNPKSKNFVGSREFMQSVISDVMVSKQSALPKVNTQAEYDALPPGAQYLGPGDVVATKTTKTKAPPAPPSDFQQWMAATGGALKPGQTQAQAIAEWKARK